MHTIDISSTLYGSVSTEHMSTISSIAAIRNASLYIILLIKTTVWLETPKWVTKKVSRGGHHSMCNHIISFVGTCSRSTCSKAMA